MVRTGYPVVYRPNSVQFEPPAVVDGEVIQPVRMTDADGQAWIAFYPMQRQADGAWRIDGCQLTACGATGSDAAAHAGPVTRPRILSNPVIPASEESP